MADTTQEILLERFDEAANGLTSPLRNASQSVDAIPARMGTEGSNPQSSNSTGPSSASEALSIATTVLEGGLGIVPLVTGLIGLLTGGGSDAPPSLVKYAMPEKIQFAGADTGSGISGADFDQIGMPRGFTGTPAGTYSSTATPGSAGPSAPMAGPQIQVNVQAMDAQSFMDRSSDIAQAVRSAMLNLSSLNDVVSDL